MHNLIQAPLALLAGVFTIASPCVLPILPILLGTAVAESNRVRPLFIVAGFVLGVSLGAVWTPCAGPVLAAILARVAQAQDVGWSALLLLLYALGAGIPMLLIAYGGQFMRGRVRRLARHTERLQKVFGVLVLATARAIYFQYDVLAYAWLADVSSTLKGR